MGKADIKLVDGPTLLDSTRDVVKGLVDIARDIKRGQFGAPTTVVVVVASTRMVGIEGGQMVEEVNYDTVAFGPRVDSFTVAGVCMAGAHDQVRNAGSNLPEED